MTTDDTSTTAASSPLERQVRPRVDWWHDLKAGDMLRPIPLWNHTERAGNCMDSPTRVLSVQRGVPSQSGTTVEIQTKNGNRRCLDVAWFQRPNGLVTGCRRQSG